MRAAVFREVGQPLSLEDIPVPRPGAHQALIKVGRCGFCATDVAMTSGVGMNFPLGAAIGHEYCGEVVELGPDVTRLKVGDIVAGMPEGGCGTCPACLAGRPFDCFDGFTMMLGGFGEYTLVDERFAVRLPAGLSLTDGALVEPIASARRGAQMAPIDKDSRILILGAGAMGGGAAYWSRLRGGRKIVTSARSAWRADLMKEMGASEYLLAHELGEKLSGALGSAPDVVFECSGAPGMLAAAIDAVAVGGTVVCIGICTSPETLLLPQASYKEVSLRFTAAYSVADFQATVDAFDRGAVEPRKLVDRIIGLDEVPDHLENMRQGKTNGNKVHVDPTIAGGDH
ncbi:zinc-dependent alcohol dehydrogenase [Sphingobium mellinum]|uniref:zinc-dependent alcohol dehydrogenase n=1 Tax=Sphingobium mellinum TaxID=1387166 RepID=UPI0030ECCE79